MSEVQIFTENHRKPQILAENHRKTQSFAETHLSHLKGTTATQMGQPRLVEGRPSCARQPLASTASELQGCLN